jgi:hypothetical protein
MSRVLFRIVLQAKRKTLVGEAKTAGHPEANASSERDRPLGSRTGPPASRPEPHSRGFEGGSGHAATIPSPGLSARCVGARWMSLSKPLTKTAKDLHARSEAKIQPQERLAAMTVLNNAPELECILSRGPPLRPMLELVVGADPHNASLEFGAGAYKSPGEAACVIAIRLC